MAHLAGQTILVTGATGGIGAAITRELAAEGARVIIHYSRNSAGAEALLREINGNGWIISADLAAADGTAKLWQQAVEAAGTVHALVNNAGIRTEIPLSASDDEWRVAWQREFRVNLFAAADLCRCAIPHFKAHGGGRVVNIASRAGQRGYAATALPYGASKAALINLGKSIAASFGRDGITAVNIAPGWVATDMAETFVAKFGKAAAVADIPIGEMADTREIAELVAFVLRPGQHSLNGATLDVNGGSYIR
jgi:NAD(P)-dependent dehydrogenase (short-subunit alcohol dehydrogenase family)